jgi:hypothetical protein
LGAREWKWLGGFKERNNILYASNVSIEKSDGAKNKKKKRKRKSWINFRV